MKHLTPVLLLLGGCVFVDEAPTERPPPDAPAGCDEDQDGVYGDACGGPDCDDLDPDVRPGAVEQYGDDLDQDCDGSPDARADVIQAPARASTLDFAWSDGAATLSGVVKTQHGKVAAVDYRFESPSSLGVMRRTDLAAAEGVVAGVRLGGHAALMREDIAEIWTLQGQKVGEVGWAGERLPSIGTTTGPDVWLTCDGERVTAVFVDQHTWQERARHVLDRPATTCAVLGGEDPVVVLAGPNLDLERWILSAEEGFTDRLRMGAARPGHLVARSDDGGSAFGFLASGSLVVFDRDGHGDLVGDGRATSMFDVAVRDGHVLVTWIDVEGELWVALGPVGRELVVHRLRGDQRPERIAAVLTESELAVAVLEGTRVTLLRAAW